MRSVRTVIISLITLAAATLAGPLVFLAPAGAQAQWTCAADQSPNYHPCVPLATDLNCDDIGFSVHVAGGDPYDLDRDGDGIGCDAEYGAPAALPAPTASVDPTAVPSPTASVDPTAVPATADPTPTLSGLMPTVDGQCLTLTFDTADVAPVTIVTPDGNVTSFTNEAGQWVIGADNNLTFTPAVNAAFPAGVNLNGTTNGQTVVITAIAECLSGRLAQVGTAPPTPGPVMTPGPALTPVPVIDPPRPELAYTGSSTVPMAVAGVALLLVGGAVLMASDRIRG